MKARFALNTLAAVLRPMSFSETPIAM